MEKVYYSIIMIGKEVEAFIQSFVTIKSSIKNYVEWKTV